MIAANNSMDPRWERPATWKAWEAAVLPYLRDERDITIVRAMLRIGLVVPLLALGMFLAPTWMVPWLAVPYTAFIWIMYGGTFTLMLHCVAHRATFKKEYDALNHIIPWFLGPFFGQTPGSFYVHHMGMHHPENNTATDLSTTICYKRDEITSFLHYWSRFFFVGWVHLVRYLRIRGRDKLRRQFITGELSWLGAMLVLGWINPTATFFVFVFQMVFIRFMMMAGNFGQHAFVDVNDPNNAWTNSTNLINTPYNRDCFNDGYHIVHHIKPAMHWTEMAQWYADNIEKFAEQDSVVFSGLQDNQAVWWLVVTRQYGTLADHLVDFKGRTREERIAFLQSRTRPFVGRPMGILELEAEPALAAK